MEEGSELIERLKYGGKLPMITSCSPGWINFCEKYYPDFVENLSTCKSPHMMLGALIKTYYAEKMAGTQKMCMWFQSCPAQQRRLKLKGLKTCTMACRMLTQSYHTRASTHD